MKDIFSKIGSIYRTYKGRSFSHLASGAYRRIMRKSMEYVPKIANIFTPRLFAVAIEPTNFCNLHCKTCYAQRPLLYQPRQKGVMEWALYKKIIDELSQLNYVIELGLNFGGESMLHNKFAKMLEYAASKKVFQIGFNTNGMLLTDDVAQAIVNNRIDRITISLDGLRERHQSIRVGSNYNIVARNIINLIRKRGAYTKPQIITNLTVSEHTPVEITEFINRWVNIVDCVVIEPCQNENLEVINRMTFFDQPTNQKKYCNFPFFYLAILWNGDVTTCCYDIAGINVLGNITKQKIIEVWQSKPFTSLRYAALTNTFGPEILCSKCNVWRTEFIPSSKQTGKIRSHYDRHCKSYQLVKD
ncbi:MAG: radical SAM protein [Planctomycetes bacterium]|nr:radical SAM protein [Planctomycetota bacterium]